MTAIIPPRRFDVVGRATERVLFVVDRLSDRPACLKVSTSSSPDARAEIAREYERLSRVEHPNLPRALDFGELEDGRAWLAMERAAGTAPVGPIDASALVQVIAGTCDALAALHARGLVHGDVKPSNVRYEPATGRVVLLDLGLARSTSGSGGDSPADEPVGGTVGYVAPEVLAGGPVGPRADLHALGAFLVRAATGRAAFAGSEDEIRRAQREAEPWLPSPAESDLPAAFWSVVACLLDQSPERRPCSAREAKRRLLEALGEAAPSSGHRLATLSPPAFVGRERELQVVLDAADVAADRPVVLTVCGAPGSGRTRLLREAVHRLRLSGRCVASALDGREDHPLRDLRASLQARMETAADGAAEAADLVDETASLVAALAASQVSGPASRSGAEARSLVVVLDDADRNERVARDVVRLASSLGDQPVLLLCSSREVPRLDGRLAEWPSVSLPPLDDESVAALLDSCLEGRAPEALVQFALDRDLRDPAVLCDLVRSNVAREALIDLGDSWRVTGELTRPPAHDEDPFAGLDDDACAVASALATLARVVTLRELATVADVPVARAAAAARRLIGAGLATPDGDGFAPTERAPREVAIALDIESFRALHDRAAEAITNDEVALLRHRAQGTDGAVALVASMRLAETALESGRFGAARGHAEAGLERVAELKLVAEAAEGETDETGGGEAETSSADGTAALPLDDAALAMHEARLLGALAAAEERDGLLADAALRREEAVEAARRSGRRDALRAALHASARARSRQDEIALARERLEEALELAPASPRPAARFGSSGPDADASARASILVDLADLDRRLGDTASAERRLTEATSLHAATGDRVGEGRVLLSRGRLAVHRGDHRGARESLRAAVGCFEEGGDRAASVTALRELGWSQYLAGDLSAAGRTLRTALNLVEKIGDRRLVADVLTALGAVSAETASGGEAISCYRQALAAYRRIGSVRGQLAAGNNLGWQLFVAGDVAQAIAAFREVMALHRRTDGVPGLGMTLNNLGIASCASAEYAEALDHCEHALSLATELDDPRLEAEACWGIGRAFSSLGATSDGIRWQRRALEVATRIENPLDRSYALSELGPLQVREGNLVAAGEALEEARREARAAGVRGQEALAQARLGRLLAARGRLGEGLRLLVEAVDESRAAGDRLTEIEAVRELGSLRCELGDFERGITLLDSALAGATQSGYFQELPAAHHALGRAWLRRALRLKTPTGSVVDRQQIDTAARHVERGLDLTASTGRTADRAALQTLAAEIALARGESARALKLVEAAHRIAMDVGDLFVASRARLTRATALVANREFGTALQEARAACDGLEKMGAADEVWRARALLSRIHGAWGVGESQAVEAAAAEEGLRALAESLDDVETVESFYADVERRAALAPPECSDGRRLRRCAPTSIDTARHAGHVDPDDLLDALSTAEATLESWRGQAKAARQRVRESLLRRRLLERAPEVLDGAGPISVRLERLLERTVRALGAERGFLVETQGERHRVIASTGTDGCSVELPDHSVSEGIVRDVVSSGRPVSSRDARSDERYGELRSVRALELRSLACVPIRWDREVRGVLYLDHARRQGAFRERDVRVLVSLARIVGVALGAEARIPERSSASLAVSRPS